MLEKQKADLRKEIRGQLRLLPEEEKEILDRQIAERVLTLPAVTDAGAVYGYASLNWETGTAEILKELWKKKCIVCLPRVMGETMEFFVTDSEDDLTEGAFHIMEPKNGCRSAEEYHSEIASEKMDQEFHQKSRYIFRQHRSWCQAWDLRKTASALEKAADIMTGIWRRIPVIRPLPWHTSSRSFMSSRRSRMTRAWI